MGNEDVVVCKENCNSYKTSDCADIETTKQALHSLSDETHDEKNKLLDFSSIMPVELVEEIFMYLNLKDLSACSAVSKRWREAVNSNRIWGAKCDEREWKDNPNLSSSHFYKSHRQFRMMGHSYYSFSPICQKRLLFNQYSSLCDNWKSGKYIIHKISNETQKSFELTEPIACDGNYLVLIEKSDKMGIGLAVWSIDEVPFQLCSLLLPNKLHEIEAIAIDYKTIVISQGQILRVYCYKLMVNKFIECFTKYELFDMMPTNTKLLNEAKRSRPNLKITQEYIICVPGFSQSTGEFVPIFFWDRITGQLKHTLHFDCMYHQITSAVFHGDSCYVGLGNYKKKEYKIVEFSLKRAVWESFSSNLKKDVDQIAVSNLYIMAITSKTPIYNVYARRETCKDVHLWDRITGSALKTVSVEGRGFQFVCDCLMFFDSARVTVMHPKFLNGPSVFKIHGTVLAIKAIWHPSLMLIIKANAHLEVWDWSRGCRLYTINGDVSLSTNLWCDTKRVITSQSPSSTGTIFVIGFW